METTSDDFLAIFKICKPSNVEFLKRLHHFAVSSGWIVLPVLAPNLWPKHKAKVKRGITREEHEAILAQENQ